MWESKVTRVAGTFKEERKVRGFSLTYFEMTCIKMCSAGRERLTESSDLTKTWTLTPPTCPTDFCGGTRALRWRRDTSPTHVGANEQRNRTLKARALHHDWTALGSSTKGQTLGKRSAKTSSAEGAKQRPSDWRPDMGHEHNRTRESQKTPAPWKTLLEDGKKHQGGKYLKTTGQLSTIPRL